MSNTPSQALSLQRAGLGPKSFVDSCRLCCSSPSPVIVDLVRSAAQPQLPAWSCALSHVTLVLVRVHLGKLQPLVRSPLLQCQHPKSDVLHAPWSALLDDVKRAAAVTVQHRDRRFTQFFQHRGEPQSLDCTSTQCIQLALCRAQCHARLKPRPCSSGAPTEVEHPARR